jgi:hypothetical protein
MFARAHIHEKRKKVSACFVCFVACSSWCIKELCFFIKLKDFMVVENWWNFDYKKQKIAPS